MIRNVAPVEAPCIFLENLLKIQIHIKKQKMLGNEATKKDVDFALVFGRKNLQKSSSCVDAVSIRENDTKNSG